MIKMISYQPRPSTGGLFFIFGAVALCLLAGGGLALAQGQTKAPMPSITLDTAASPGQAKDKPLSQLLSEAEPNVLSEDEPEEAISLHEQVSLKRKIKIDEITPEDLTSIFFTRWQYSLLQEAKQGFLSRPVTDAELNSDDDLTPRAGRRELVLGGIVYTTHEDWTIWLNGERVTPGAIPDHVVDLKVQDRYIDLKWFDTSTNLIFPIRLRPHERFNLDTRMFLPGNGKS